MVSNGLIIGLILCIFAGGAIALIGVFIGAKLVAPEREFFHLPSISKTDPDEIEEDEPLVPMSARDKARAYDQDFAETIEPAEAEPDDTPNDFKEV